VMLADPDGYVWALGMTIPAKEKLG
jgi:hypothetical protein